MSSDANDNFQSAAHKAAALSRADGPDLVRSAFDYLRGVPPAGGGSSGTPSIARQKESLREWARSLGLLLKADQFVPRLTRGGQEHDIFGKAGRVFKVKTPHHPDAGPGDGDALLSENEKLLARSAETPSQLKAQLMEPFSR